MGPPMNLSFNLNEIWSEHDGGNGRFYYYNKITKASIWQKPPGFISKRDLNKPLYSEQIPNTDWKIVHTMGGKPYYFNTVTKDTVWKLPEDIKIDDNNQNNMENDNENNNMEK